MGPDRRPRRTVRPASMAGVGGSGRPGTPSHQPTQNAKRQENQLQDGPGEQDRQDGEDGQCGVEHGRSRCRTRCRGRMMTIRNRLRPERGEMVDGTVVPRGRLSRIPRPQGRPRRSMRVRARSLLGTCGSAARPLTALRSWLTVTPLSARKSRRSPRRAATGLRRTPRHVSPRRSRRPDGGIRGGIAGRPPLRPQRVRHEGRAGGEPVRVQEPRRGAVRMGRQAVIAFAGDEETMGRAAPSTFWTPSRRHAGMR